GLEPGWVHPDQGTRVRFFWTGTISSGYQIFKNPLDSISIPPLMQPLRKI
ncbi:13570_t:CDS:1, partial [Entrophospora sp. SA101]